MLSELRVLYETLISHTQGEKYSSFLSSSRFLPIIAVTLHGKSASQLNIYQLPPLPEGVLH